MSWARMMRLAILHQLIACHTFIGDHKIIDNIIDHLKLSFHAERPPLRQVVQQELFMAVEESGEYF